MTMGKMKIYVAGLHLGGAAYPNAQNTLKLLGENPDFDIVECGAWLPPDLRLWSLAKGSKKTLLSFLGRVLFGNLFSLIKVIYRNARQPGLVYVPYPSLFFLWLVSFLPARLRPFCVADAYISVWDSMFRDRAMLQAEGFFSRLVRRIEARSLQAAALVLVDTEANKAVFVELFALDENRVLSLPLAIDQQHFKAIAAPVHHNNSLTVLFVGTLIPLHGISVLLEAIRQLASDPRFTFRLLGDGQLSNEVADFLQNNPALHVHWLRQWCSLEEISQEINRADICLGVFGGEEKAARVLPFKLYMYLAAGRAIISQSLFSVPQGLPPPPVFCVVPADAASLVTALRSLADDEKTRQRLAQQSKTYFNEWLSQARVLAVWTDNIAPRFSSRK